MTAVKDAILEVRDLGVEFHTRDGIRKAVDRVSFSLGHAEIIGLVGESGSGKSVTGLSVMGLLPPTARISGGQILFHGRDLVTMSETEKRSVRGSRISMVFQDPLSALNPGLTVGYQIGEMLRRRKGASKAEAKAAAVELMDRMRIPEAKSRGDNYPHQFSGGMRQRVMIAMALAMQPEVLIADEPTTALDVTVQKQIIYLLREIQESENLAIVMISHNVGLVSDFADRVAVMYAGRIVDVGPLPSVLAEPAHPYTRGLMRSVPSLDRTAARLVPIAGAPPDPANPVSGCSFHPRCDFVRSRCFSESPDLELVNAGHLAACHYSSDVQASHGV